MSKDAQVQLSQIMQHQQRQQRVKMLRDDHTMIPTVAFMI